MDIVNVERIREFTSRNPRASTPMRRWETVVRESAWRTFQDVQATFNTADYVQGKVVFDVGGNKYRLVAVVDYQGQQVIVRAVMTHREYDRERWTR
jgi:mRNA interferase HigB